MRKAVEHIPADGKASGLQGEAMCGKWAHYQTGDHALIRRLAAQNGDGFCKRCLAKMSPKK